MNPHNEPAAYLTKREYAAIHILAGLVANPELANATELINTSRAENLAAQLANSLLTKLEQSKPK